MKGVFANRIYSGTEVHQEGFLLFEDSSIRSISSSWNGKPEGSYDVITPAFIDPHAHIGMIRAGEPQSEAEINERMEPILAHADALDSVQMDDESFKQSVEAGVLYSCVLPGSGNIIGGKSAVIRNYAKNTTEALVCRAGTKAAIGYNPMSTTEWKGARPFTRMGAFALLKSKLHDVREKMKGSGESEPKFTAEEEVFRSLLRGRELLRVHVHKVDDIAAVLRLVDEYHLRITVEHTCGVNDPHIYTELAERGIPVVYGPLDSLSYKVELKHESWQNIRGLISSSVQFGLMTDHPVILQNMLFYQLRWFLRCGMSKQEVIEIITRQNARILGVNEFLGTLSRGAWASFVCWNGDPFDLSSYPVAVYAEGKLIHAA